ncbi:MULTISPECIES: GNAT family N-acetyltransferase [unclassified Moraxella]|uniref:GNAT family N-acetyltransferase n=1 Tax=unclassified Moraxella TaxID=2685852 RepID=UPI003AF626FC
MLTHPITHHPHDSQPTPPIVDWGRFKADISIPTHTSINPNVTLEAFTQPSPLYHSVIIAPHHFSNAQFNQHLLNAQRLRTQTFSEAFGVDFTGFHPSSDQPLDIDEYDSYCTHVIIYDNQRKDSFGQPLAIATTRLMDKTVAGKIGHFYSENEFKLGKMLDAYPYNVLEIGRTCIHPDYRGMTTINPLWEGISKVAKALNVNAFMGCASVPMEQGNVQDWLDNLPTTAKLAIKAKHAIPSDKLTKVSVADVADIDLMNPKNLALPALLKMYVRMGCSVGSTACYDADFDCADVLIWLPFEQVKSRYQHYIH